MSNDKACSSCGDLKKIKYYKETGDNLCPPCARDNDEQPKASCVNCKSIICMPGDRQHGDMCNPDTCNCYDCRWSRAGCLVKEKQKKDKVIADKIAKLLDDNQTSFDNIISTESLNVYLKDSEVVATANMNTMELIFYMYDYQNAIE